MKIAILHDYFDKMGGGERLVLNLARALKADVYTGFIEKSKTFDTNGVNITSLNVRGIGVYKKMRIAKAFEQYNFPKYDFYIFSGVWCISASRRLHPNAIYLHTPMRAIYDLKNYFIKKSNPIKRIFLRRFAKYWMPKDKYYMEGFDAIAANSENVKGRVLRYYGKELYKRTRVVYTGIKTDEYYYKKSGDFYLSAARLDPLKRIDMIINVFRKMPKRKLVMTGTGPDENRLKAIAEGYGNIEFLGQVDDKKLKELYSTCKATIAANIDEDLGLIAIESHASGKPIVAIAEGGFLETVDADVNGVFFKDEETLATAIERLEKIRWDHRKIQRTAKRFDIENFTDRMKAVIEIAARK